LAQRGDHRIPIIFGRPLLIDQMAAARALALRDCHAIHMALTSD